jgi:hypothetical protein
MNYFPEFKRGHTDLVRKVRSRFWFKAHRVKVGLIGAWPGLNQGLYIQGRRYLRLKRTPYLPKPIPYVKFAAIKIRKKY